MTLNLTCTAVALLAVSSLYGCSSTPSEIIDQRAPEGVTSVSAPGAAVYKLMSEKASDCYQREMINVKADYHETSDEGRIVVWFETSFQQFPQGLALIEGHGDTSTVTTYTGGFGRHKDPGEAMTDWAKTIETPQSWKCTPSWYGAPKDQ